MVARERRKKKEKKEKKKKKKEMKKGVKKKKEKEKEMKKKKMKKEEKEKEKQSQATMIGLRVTLPTYNVGGSADKRRQFGKEEKKHTLGPDVGTRQSREEKQEDARGRRIKKYGLFCWLQSKRSARGNLVQVPPLPSIGASVLANFAPL